MKRILIFGVLAAALVAGIGIYLAQPDPAPEAATDESVAVVVPAQVETPAADTRSDEDAQPEMVEESAAQDIQEQVADRPLLRAQADT